MCLGGLESHPEVLRASSMALEPKITPRGFQGTIHGARVEAGINCMKAYCHLFVCVLNKYSHYKCRLNSLYLNFGVLANASLEKYVFL